MYEVVNIKDKGGGLIASCDISEGTLIQSWAPGTYFTAAEAFKDENFIDKVRLKHEELHSAEKVVMSTYLAIFRNEKTKWTDLIAKLPEDYQTPIWETDLEVEFKRIPSLWKAIEAKRTYMVRCWTSLGQPAAPEDYQWAESIITSRCIALPTRPEGELALVPQLDMCNHSFDPNVRWEHKDGTIQLMATSEIPAGTELLLSYGPEKTNQQLYFGYGFTLPCKNWNLTIFFQPDDEDEKWTNYWATARIPNNHRQIRFDEQSIKGGVTDHPLSSGALRLWKDMFKLDEAGTDLLMVMYLSACPDLIQRQSLLMQMLTTPLDRATDNLREATYRYSRNVLRLLRKRVSPKTVQQTSSDEIIQRILDDERRGALKVLDKLEIVENCISRINPL